MEVLKIYCDGGARGNPGPAASAFVVIDKNGKVIFTKGKYIRETTNNIAEYTAVLLALDWMADNNITGPVTFFLDSQLIVNQLTGVFQIRDKKLMVLAQIAKEKERALPVRIVYRAIPRTQNKIADFLINKVLNRETKNPKTDRHYN